MTYPSEWFLSGLVSGGLLLRIIDYLVAWKKERREQRSAQLAHEKDRPRFRIDISKVPTSHSNVPAARVEILSLGSLPLTINEGEVFIETDQRPEHVESRQLNGREISALSPIVFEFPLPEKLVNPHGVGKPVVKVVCDFSYGTDDRYHDEKTYNHQTREFE
jgi:hypothetical protein